MCRRVGLGCAVILALLAGVAGFLFYSLSRNDPSVAAAAQPVTPQEQAAATELSDTIEKRFEKPARPSPTAPPDPSLFELTLLEEEANQMLRAHPDTRGEFQKSGIEAVVLEFREGELVMKARAALPGGIKTQVTVMGTLTAEGGSVRYKTTDAKVGALPAPKQGREELDKGIAAAFNRIFGEGEVRMDEVTLTPGKMKLRGKRKPKK